MTKYGMVIDLNKCTGCLNCHVSCRDEYVDNDWPPYSAAQPDMGHFWMHVEERTRGQVPKVKVAWIPQPCMQCQNPPCVGASTGGAAYLRPDGITIFDPVKSVGQHQIVPSCPYGVVYWNDDTGIPQKCTFCAHLLDRNEGWEPKCVNSCPVGAITFGDLEAPNSAVAKLVATGEPQPLHPEYGAKPNVFYINIPKTFLAASVVDKTNDECFEGADVTLTDIAAGKTMTTKTDNYGDFEFEGLDSGKVYSLRIEAPGYTAITMDSIALNTDTYLGDLFLGK
jgi:Fe-S-cluster-containing dehydrogenase component